VLAMEQGQHDRNAGHGPGTDLLGNAHLSALDEQNKLKPSNIRMTRLRRRSSNDWKFLKVN